MSISLIVGGRRTGKTTLAKKYIDENVKTIVYSESSNVEFPHMSNLTLHKEKPTIYDIEDIKNLSKVLLILDEVSFIDEFSSLFVNIGHYNAEIVVVSQNINSLSPKIRDCINKIITTNNVERGVYKLEILELMVVDV